MFWRSWTAYEASSMGENNPCTEEHVGPGRCWLHRQFMKRCGQFVSPLITFFYFTGWSKLLTLGDPFKTSDVYKNVMFTVTQAINPYQPLILTVVFPNFIWVSRILYTLLMHCRHCTFLWCSHCIHGSTTKYRLFSKSFIVLYHSFFSIFNLQHGVYEDSWVLNESQILQLEQMSTSIKSLCWNKVIQ